jgi:hypothetical protein
MVTWALLLDIETRRVVLGIALGLLYAAVWVIAMLSRKPKP